MSDRDALLAAVVADPDADAPRLVFADHLEETGDDAWAELIRHQCGYYRTHQDDMRAKLDALVAATADRWPRWDGVRLGPPVRGFPEQVEFHDQDGVYHWPDILTRLPVTRVGLYWDCHGLDVAAARLVPLMATGRVRVLVLNFVDLGDQIDGLLTAVRPGSLQALIWRNANLRDADAVALAAAPSLVGLEELCVASNELTDAAANAIIDSPHLARLRFLDLSFNRLTRSHARLVARFGRGVWL